jgi:hypothetical protein
VARVRYQNSGHGVLGNGLGPVPGAMPRADRALNIGLRYGF